MDQGAKIIILEDEKAARKLSQTYILGENLRRALLERRAELVAEELDKILMELAEEE